MTKSICRSCGKPIQWMTTKNGRRMPCDDALVRYWAKPDGRSSVITFAGEIQRCELKGEPGAESGQGRIPHWNTCDRTKQLRKSGRT